MNGLDRCFFDQRESQQHGDDCSYSYISLGRLHPYGSGSGSGSSSGSGRRRARSGLSDSPTAPATPTSASDNASDATLTDSELPLARDSTLLHNGMLRSTFDRPDHERDSQVAYLYVIRKFGFTEVEYSVYGTINIVLGIFGTLFCVYILSQRLNVQDSAIGALAATSRIASCFMFAFAPTRPLYYSAPILNIFSHTGLTAIRSIASKSVPTEEVAKLNALIGVTEAIAPSIYMPSTSYIYVQTISSFPGAFYMFDAVLTVVALGLFSVIYILVRRRMRVTVTDPQKKEEFARTNEVSRF